MTIDQLPEVMDVEDIQKFLGIGRNQAYDLCNSGQFHVIRIGRRIKVARENFVTWFKGQ